MADTYIAGTSITTQKWSVYTSANFLKLYEEIVIEEAVPGICKLNLFNGAVTQPDDVLVDLLYEKVKLGLGETLVAGGIFNQLREMDWRYKDLVASYNKKRLICAGFTGQSPNQLLAKLYVVEFHEAVEAYDFVFNEKSELHRRLCELAYG